MTSQEKCDIHFSTGLGPTPIVVPEEVIYARGWHGRLLGDSSRLWETRLVQIVVIECGQERLQSTGLEISHIKGFVD